MTSIQINRRQRRELRKAIHNKGCKYNSTNRPTFWQTVPDKLLGFFIEERYRQTSLRYTKIFIRTLMTHQSY